MSRSKSHGHPTVHVIDINSKGNSVVSKHTAKTLTSHESSKVSRGHGGLSEHHHHHDDHIIVDKRNDNKVDAVQPSGKNVSGDCFCQPCWCFCCNRICKVTTAVEFVAWFDCMVNLSLMVIALFALMLWRNHGKYVEERGFSRKNEEWAAVMEPNEDGIYMLGFSYLMIWPISFWVAVKYSHMRRLEPIAWCITVFYATGLQVVSLIVFPFDASLVNIPFWIFRIYEFWIMCHYDYLLRNRSHRLTTNSEIEAGICAAEGAVSR
jgi:hypothetical protein